MNEPTIEYPCEWSYRIIGSDEQALRQAASESLGALAYQITLSNQSTGKKYLSMNLTVTVETQAMRDQIFTALEKHPAVRFML
jgi:putative lipoic acid-binding regulatory protein